MVATATIERPALSGVYLVADAAALIHATSPAVETLPAGYHPLREATTRHLFRWVKEGLTGSYLVGLKGKDVALTFLDLISLRMIAVFRSYGIKPNEIRAAHNALQGTRGWTHPFAMEPLWLSGLHIYAKENKIPLAITKHWQAAFNFIGLFVGPVHRLAFDEDQLAKTWEPEPDILLDPKISFGEPCIKGTRIATQVLWALKEAGDPPERIAEAYQLPVEQVEAAIAWENKLAA